MRVVVAPSAFTGTLTATQAAREIARGWLDTAPGDEVVQLPVSGGGPGLLEAVQTGVEQSGGVPVLSVTEVTGPDGRTRVPAALLQVGDTVWIEAAQVCGAGVLGTRDPATATSRGVGELLGLAVAAGAGTVVVGLGGALVGDGGRGVFTALGGGDPLDTGRGYRAAAAAAVGGVRVVAAGTTDDPLGPGPAREFADVLTRALAGDPGGTPAEEPPHHPELDGPGAVPAPGRSPRAAGARRALPLLGARVDRALPDRAGAGSGSGLGFALLALGGVYRPGIDEVLDATGLPAVLAASDLVLTGEGSFDHRSRTGSAVGGVAAAAGAAGLACVVLAGRTQLGSRETRALGIGSAYAIDSLPGWRELGPAANLRRLAARVARTWAAG